MRLSCALILLLCAHLALSRSLTKKKTKSESKDRKLPTKKTKTIKPDSSSSTRSPTLTPTGSLLPWPTGTPSLENIFVLEPVYTPDPPSQETLDNGDIVPLYVTVSVSVALSSSAPTQQLEVVRVGVAKVTTLAVGSFTPFIVGRQRGLESTTTELMYDEEHSGVSLVSHGPEVSWWKHAVAYSVSKGPVEEQDEIDSIATLTESSVEGAVQSGLFAQLLAKETADVLAVAIPGSENEQELNDTPVEATTSEEGKKKWDSRAIVLVTCVGASILLAAALVAAFAIISMRRRRQAREREVWGITMGEQKDMGEVLNAEWKSDYSEASAPTKLPDILMPGHGSEQVTTTGTNTCSIESKSLT